MKEGFEIYVHFSVVLFSQNLRLKIPKQIFKTVVTFYEFQSFPKVVLNSCIFIQREIVIHKLTSYLNNITYVLHFIACKSLCKFN